MAIPSQEKIEEKILELAKNGDLVNQRGFSAYIINQLDCVSGPEIKDAVFAAVASLTTKDLIEYNADGLTFNITAKAAGPS